MLAISVDGEAKHKKAMGHFDMLVPEIALVQFVQETMHVETSLKCSWGNWFVIVDGQMSNLVLLTTLHEFVPDPVKQELHNLLYLRVSTQQRLNGR